MTARDRILAAVRSRLGRPAAGGIPEAGPPPLPAYPAVDADAASLLAQFATRLQQVGGQLHDGRHDGGRAAFAALQARLRPQRIARSDGAAVATLCAAFPDAPWLPVDAARDALFAAELGVTAVQWAIADTGTLVLDAGAEQHRLASLLPPVHVALLPTSRVLADLGAALRALPQPLPAAVTFITGPSRTADIELQLVIGVHGPRELHVVLVPG